MYSFKKKSKVTDIIHNTHHLGENIEKNLLYNNWDAFRFAIQSPFDIQNNPISVVKKQPYIQTKHNQQLQESNRSLKFEKILKLTGAIYYSTLSLSDICKPRGEVDHFYGLGEGVKL